MGRQRAKIYVEMLQDSEKMTLWINTRIVVNFTQMCNHSEQAPKAILQDRNMIN